VNLDQCVSRMIPPGQYRKGKYRGGVIQVWVTRACDKSCHNCTQASNVGPLPLEPNGDPKWDYMSPDQFELALKSLEGYWGVVGMFGGNPAMHPEFDKLCTIMRRHVPSPQRGIWSNNPLTPERAKIMRNTFSPYVSNLNVHQDSKAYDLFKKHWPESIVVGLAQDSRHSPTYVAMKDVLKKTCPNCDGINHTIDKTCDEWCRTCDGTGTVPNEETIWDLVSQCDINQHWSSMIGVFRGQVRAWFCEIAGAQAMLHQHEPNYPDTGVSLENLEKYGSARKWWEFPMTSFSNQVHKHCMDCGIPLRGFGELSQDPNAQSQVSATHQKLYHPKKNGKAELVMAPEQLGPKLPNVISYLANARAKR
jgi:organic radical activating enzyme